MEEDRPKYVRRIGLTIIVVSVYVLMTTCFRIGIHIFIGGLDFFDYLLEGAGFAQFLSRHDLILSILSVAIWAAYFIGGLGIRDYKLKALKLVTFTTNFVLLESVVYFMSGLSILHLIPEESFAFHIAGLVISAIKIGLVGLAVWYLNQDEIKKHFI